MVDGLLLLSRADAGVLRMDRKPVDLGQLVMTVYEQTRILAASHNLTLEIGEFEPVTITGDQDRLQRLLLNLVDNAIKYTPPGRCVTLSLKVGDGVSLSVTDTGMGVASTEHQQIFQRFFRSPDARTLGQPGSGLGLCIALSIAEAHGGSIQVESSLGNGSTFTLRLPMSD